MARKDLKATPFTRNSFHVMIRSLKVRKQCSPLHLNRGKNNSSD